MDQQEKREEPLTFADLGITAAPKLEEGALGKKRPLKDLEKKEIAFAVISILSSLGAIGLAIQRLATTSNGNPDFTFALVIIVNAVFCMYYVFHGLLAERPYEIIVMVLATIAVTIYVIVNFILGPKKDVKIARLVLVCILSPIIVVMGFIIAKEYHDSGRLIFRMVGADSTLQGFCKNLFLFLGLQKFDLQLNVTMVLLILQSGTKVDTEDIVIISVGVPVTIACFALGYLSVRWENKTLGIVYAVSLFLAPAYIIFKVYESADDLAKTSTTQFQNGTTLEVPTRQNAALSGTTFTSAGLALLIRVLMAIYFVKAVLNFGYGLKYKVYGGTEPPSKENETPPQAAQP
ncbi:uncharacterized protein LOC133172236 isoform X2 [Saccostrea echinata]|uniref:uncharacterized protein LOC133172236 isoform X2 n=1 Tax=Saccostrea echinata TaxID=191078 RepID=UPI002A82AE73|nr:uncharacterized protein LOC133172236 isoform X2 [Saccostrea echinata]